MHEDTRLEIARLKDHLHRVKQVSELQRKMAEDAEFENRELKRKVESTKTLFIQFLQQYQSLTTQVATAGDLEMRELMELCDAALKSVEKVIGEL